MSERLKQAKKIKGLLQVGIQQYPVFNFESCQMWIEMETTF